MGIVDVAKVTLRGFRMNAPRAEHVFFGGTSEGALLDGLDFETNETDSFIGIALTELPLTRAPISVRNCIFHSNAVGLFIQARVYKERFDVPQPCANIIIRDNEFVGSRIAILMAGAPQRILIAQNRMVNCGVGIDFREFLPEAKDVLVANNTLFANGNPIMVWDEKDTGLRCKNIRCQNNLVLSPKRPTDFCFFDHKRGEFKNDEKPGDVPRLLKAWRFSHNWRETSPPPADNRYAKAWISPGPNDVLMNPIPKISRDRDNQQFLRIPNDSELATKGAGKSDPALPLPAYVGAYAPDGADGAKDEWDWLKTWKALSQIPQ